MCAEGGPQIHVCLYFCVCGCMCEEIIHRLQADMCVDVCVCVLQVTAGMVLQQRRPDTPLLRARISLTCQIGGSVTLAAGPASHRKYFLSICELGTERLGREGGKCGEYIGLEEKGEERQSINYSIWSDWINIG